MNTLVQTYLAPTKLNNLRNSNQLFPEQKADAFRYNQNHTVPTHGTTSSAVTEEPSLSENGGFSSESPPSSLDSNDHSNAIFKYIAEMLMEEEDLSNKPCMLNDCLALQATEKSLYDVLTNNVESVCSSDASNCCGFEVHSSSLGFIDGPKSDRKEKKKNRHRDEEGDDCKEGQSSCKHSAGNNIEELSIEMYDKVLLCSNTDFSVQDCPKFEAEKKPSRSCLHPKATGGSNRGRPKAGGQKIQPPIREVVDLRALLIQCAHALSSYDHRAFDDLLSKVRKHSSPHGDGTERLAHYMANALQTRLGGTARGSHFISPNISAAQILKGYETFITACPFRKMSHVLANRTINKLASNSSTLHIIDFGIFYGFQWPCLIQILSKRPGGPPKLRITGIDFPQSGFRPAERVEDTGRRLTKYCKRFNVPFEYNAIAQKWDTIKLEDLRLEKGEMVVVNSLYRLRGLLDESVVVVESPRDKVLSLIGEIRPNMLILGVVNGTYNAPFFLTRFKEALFHYSSMFDMVDAAVVDRDDPARKLYEEEVLGKEVMNVVACEGTERIDRPETYKQWQARGLRAGFRQMDLDRDIVGYVRRRVKREYHKDFLVDEDGKWLLQGWRGRVTNAISYWKPVNK